MEQGRRPGAERALLDVSCGVVGPLRNGMRSVGGAAAPRVMPDGGARGTAYRTIMVGGPVDGKEIGFSPYGLLDDAAQRSTHGRADGVRSKKNKPNGRPVDTVVVQAKLCVILMTGGVVEAPSDEFNIKVTSRLPAKYE